MIVVKHGCIVVPAASHANFHGAGVLATEVSTRDNAAESGEIQRPSKAKMEFRATKG